MAASATIHARRALFSYDKKTSEICSSLNPNQIIPVADYPNNPVNSAPWGEVDHRLIFEPDSREFYFAPTCAMSPSESWTVAKADFLPIRRLNLARCLALALFITLQAIGTHAQERIKPSDAGRYIGKRVTVCGQVASANFAA